MMKQFFLILLLAVVVYGCGPEDRYEADVSEISVDLEIKRLDKDLFDLNPDSVHKAIPVLSEKYGAFFELYNKNVINIGGSNSRAYPDNLQAFLNDYDMNQLHKKIMEVYPDLEDIRAKLETGFIHYKHYFPDKKVPAVYTYMGGFNQSIVVADSVLAIGLDKYLGRDCEFYDKLGWETYRQKNMHKKKIPSDCIRAWGQTEWPFDDSTDNLLSNMLYRGKLLYFTKSMLPDEPDTLITGFSEQELNWCTSNEENIWNYLIENKLLYSTDYMTINKMVNPAPFTSGFTKASPGRAVNWLGWKIIEAYMDRNSGVTLRQLMRDHDYQRILTESRYHP
jgi:gliding motility-associated lipoprotein GldB